MGQPVFFLATLPKVKWRFGEVDIRGERVCGIIKNDNLMFNFSLQERNKLSKPSQIWVTSYYVFVLETLPSIMWLYTSRLHSKSLLSHL